MPKPKIVASLCLRDLLTEKPCLQGLNEALKVLRPWMSASSGIDIDELIENLRTPGPDGVAFTPGILEEACYVEIELKPGSRRMTDLIVNSTSMIDWVSILLEPDNLRMVVDAMTEDEEIAYLRCAGRDSCIRPDQHAAPDRRPKIVRKMFSLLAEQERR